MIHYHGLPITPGVVLGQALVGAHFFATFVHKDQSAGAIEIASSFAVDNGAFSFWRAGKPVTDWQPYYAWIEEVSRLPSFDFAVIPDVIDGTESENDDLLARWPHPSGVGAPVWHLNESLGRLQTLCSSYERVCLGSSGRYAKVGSEAWWSRMREAMAVACDPEGYPLTKLHGLRMLAGPIVESFPFKSADSTNLARNIGIDKRWRGTYTPPSKSARAAILRARIEAVHSPLKWEGGGI